MSNICTKALKTCSFIFLFICNIKLIANSPDFLTRISWGFLHAIGTGISTKRLEKEINSPDDTKIAKLYLKSTPFFRSDLDVEIWDKKNNKKIRAFSKIQSSKYQSNDSRVKFMRNIFWSNDSKKIAFCFEIFLTDNIIQIFDVQNGKQLLDASNPWSPNGTKIRFQTQTDVFDYEVQEYTISNWRNAKEYTNLFF